MGLFGKKEKAKCPICGGEMTFLKSVALADGTICLSCEAMLRGKYDIERWWSLRPDGSERLKSRDPLLDMTIDEVREMIESAKQAQAENVAAFGGEYANLLQIGDFFNIAPKATEVGIKRAKAFKNKVVVQGMVQSGEFSKDDAVVILHGDDRVETTVLDLFRCDGVMDFESAMKANMGKKQAAVNTNAWLVLDVESGVSNGDLLAKA